MTTQFQTTMTIKGLDKLLANVKDPRVLGGPVTKGMRQSALAVQREAQLLAPVDSGRLRADIHTDIDSGQPFPLWARIGPKVFYAVFVEFGTGIFGPLKRRIVPRTKRALAWTSGGQRFVRRSVKGSPAQPFMGPALDAARGQINRIWERVGREIVGEMAEGI